MSQRTLLASVVLFGELYSSDKDVYDVIAEFLKAAFLFGQKWSVNTTEATALLRNEFELDIPEAVVGTTLHKRLYKRDSAVSYENGVYSTSKAQLSDSQALVDELGGLQQHQQDVIARLTAYVESANGTLNAEQRDHLARCFCDYLFDDNLVTMYSEDISAFILKTQAEPEMTSLMNAIREGFVLYDGVRHTPDLNQLGAWRSNLVVFLDTEHLFNAVGMNGVLHQQLFKDFSDLASDVRSKGKRLIALRYFSESADEVNRFFHVAELIVSGKATLDPSKPAMAAIVDGCSSKGDVVVKKAQFFADLKALGIHKTEQKDEVVAEQFNIESSSLLKKVQDEVESKGREFQEDKCINTLSMFSKINALRAGNNSGLFEEIGFVLASGSYIANYLAFHPEIREEPGNIPYATDLEFITNRLWFKLHKNLAKGLAHPRSLSVLAKAQVNHPGNRGGCLV